MNESMTKLKAYDWGGDRGSLADIDERITAAQGDPNKLTEIEAALLDVLHSEVKLPAKEYICRKLALIGTDRAAPVLAPMLRDKALSDCARLALEAIPGPRANAALCAALEHTRGDVRVGIVNTLGERGSQSAVSALSKLRRGQDEATAVAAAAALRKIERNAAAVSKRKREK